MQRAVVVQVGDRNNIVEAVAGRVTRRRISVRAIITSRHDKQHIRSRHHLIKRAVVPIGSQAQVTDLGAIILGIPDRLDDGRCGSAAILTAEGLYRHDLDMFPLRQPGNPHAVARLRSNRTRAMGAVAVVAAREHLFPE